MPEFFLKPFEPAREMLLASQRVVPAKAQALGFSFEHPELEPALRDILGR
jgi:NAD dependent epimerase/dehydratase family enzyme